MANQGETSPEGSTTSQPGGQRPEDTKPFISNVSPHGSQPSSLELERSDSLPGGVTSDPGKNEGAANSTPETVASTDQAAAHSEEKPLDGNGHPEGVAKNTPETTAPGEKPPDEKGPLEGPASSSAVTSILQPAGYSPQDNNSPEGAALTEEGIPTTEAAYPSLVGATMGPPTTSSDLAMQNSEGARSTLHVKPVPETTYHANKGM